MWKIRNWTELRLRVAELTEKQANYEALEYEVEQLREFDQKLRKLVGLPESQVHSLKDENDAQAAGLDMKPAGVVDIVLEDAIMPGEEKLADIEKALASRLGKLRWPVDGFVSSHYGEERDRGAIHSGIDIAAARNTLIETPLSGTVRSAGWDSQYGNVAIIDHDGGLTTVYCHNEKLVVQTGEKVKRGAPISFLGSTGLSSAPHLHFEIRYEGFAVDPLLMLAQKEESRR
jgi:murein DD-endopeptidase MepM/ murein hydrolase activator NlpD